MIALTIAGYDPSGGAGILADIKTYHALNIYGTAVITALTAQNVKRVASIKPVPLDFIEKEIDLIMEEYPVSYCKTGMLFSPQVVELVSQKVLEYDLKLVVDPVLVAGSGYLLSQEKLAKALKEILLPVAYLTTPNIHEAQILSGKTINSEDDAIEVAQELGEICPVVVTGGHLKGRDFFYDQSLKIIEGTLIDNDNTHGSGCTYSSAITAYLTLGETMINAIKKAAAFVKEGIKKGNNGTLNQFWNYI
jgi:hydroxymethylpyrimidine/phosphomethylpyrimidine kinase